MTDLKYDMAVYRVKATGELKTIRVQELSDPDKLTLARTEELFDVTEQIPLNARVGEINTHHFAGKPSGGRRLVQGERDEEHDKRVAQHLAALSGKSKWTVGMLGPKKDNGKPSDFYERTDLYDYRWGSEINQIIDENTIVRHDVFGASKELAMSVRQPSVAIEVIKSHYPEEAAFAAFIEKSRREPFIVLLDVIRYKEKSIRNLVIKVDSDSKRITYRPYSFWICEGAVYKGNKKTEIDSSARLKIEVETMLATFIH